MSEPIDHHHLALILNTALKSVSMSVRQIIKLMFSLRAKNYFNYHAEMP